MIYIFDRDEQTYIVTKLSSYINYDFQVIFFATVHAEQIGHSGRSLKLLQSLLDANPTGGGGNSGNGGKV